MGEEGEEIPANFDESYAPCQCHRTCRICELAKPKKIALLSLWNEHSHVLPSDKHERLKELLLDLYAMTPEETANYFNELRKKHLKVVLHRRQRERMRKILEQKNNMKERKDAFELFKSILKNGLMYAYEHKPPELVSIRLRNLSNVILEELCAMRGTSIPDRENTDERGRFVVSIADWLAVGVEILNYRAIKDKRQMETRALNETTINYKDPVVD